MHWVLDRRTTVGFGGAIGFLTLVAIAAHWQTVRFIQGRQAVGHSHEILSALDDVNSLLRDAEAGQRGYLLTNQEDHLTLFEAAEEQLDQQFKQLSALLKDRPEQQGSLEKLQALAERKLAFMHETIRGRQAGLLTLDLQQRQLYQDKDLMDVIRRRSSAMEEEEKVTLRQVSEVLRPSAWQTNLLSALACLASLALVGLCLHHLNRSARRWLQAEQALRREQQVLEQQVQERTADLERAGEDLRAEMSLHRRTEEKTEQLAAIVESSDDAIIGVTLAGQITSWNRGAERLYGYGAEEILENPITRLLPPEAADEWPRMLEQVRQGETVAAANLACLHQNGQRVHVSWRLSPIHNRWGEIVGVAAIARDITVQQHLEEQLRQAQKMEVVGQLAGGVAHDFNNLLTVILGYSDLLLQEPPAVDQVHSVAHEIKKAAERAALLTRQLLAFSRKQIIQPQVVHLNELVTESGKMLRRLLGEDIELKLLLEPELAPIRGDLGQLEQVLVNLAINSRDAMPAGGQLTVRTRNVEREAPVTSGKGRGGPPTQWICLSVQDTGCGMTREVQSHLFEPFFTTKPVGKGTGLGLATVYGIVQQSGGRIAVSSQPGRGSTFEVYFPRWTAPAEPVRRAPNQSRPAGGSETVLVVEDDPSVRTLACRSLRQAGYTVLDARDGREGEAVASRHSGPIHLLLTDVVMPELSGRQLAERVARSRPEIKVLYASGYTQSIIARKGVLEDDMDFLEKPFTPESLVARVHQVLHRDMASSPEPIAEQVGV